MDNADLFKEIKELNLPLGEYALFGSAPMGIRGLKQCRDVDIIVTEKLWNEFKIKGWEEKISASGSEYLSRGDIELWKYWKPGIWNIRRLIEGAEIIDDLPFVKLEGVLEWKKIRGEERDINDIKTIEVFLSKNEKRRGKK